MFGSSLSARERPLAMSSASATRTIEPSIVNGAPLERCEMIACDASEQMMALVGSS